MDSVEPAQSSPSFACSFYLQSPVEGVPKGVEIPILDQCVPLGQL